MKYNTSQLGDVRAAQAAVNDQYQRQIDQARYKSIANMMQGEQTRKRMDSMAAQSKIQSMNEKLDPAVRSAYEREALAYELLGAQLPYLDPEKQADAYYRIMATIEDPRKLANELRKTQMQNDAELAKARIYANAQGGGSGNKQLQALGDLADSIVMSNDPTAASQAKPSIIDQLSGAVSGTPAFVGNLLSPRRVSTPSPYQEQPMLPMGQGITRPQPGLFQTPDLIGGFSY